VKRKTKIEFVMMCTTEFFLEII